MIKTTRKKHEEIKVGKKRRNNFGKADKQRQINK